MILTPGGVTIPILGKTLAATFEVQNTDYHRVIEHVKGFLKESVCSEGLFAQEFVASSRFSAGEFTLDALNLSFGHT